MLGRVRVANKFPDVNAPIQPSDFLASISRDFGSPRQRPTSMQELVLGRPRMLLRTHSASETGHRLSEKPGCFEERKGPPGLLGRPLRACRGATPRRIQPRLAPTSLREDPRRGHYRLRGKQNPRHPESHSFRGQIPTAHTLACLRFAGLVTATVARLATGSDGLTPSRAGFAPAGRQTKFQGDIALPPIPIDQQCLVALFFLSASCGWETSPRPSSRHRAVSRACASSLGST